VRALFAAGGSPFAQGRDKAKAVLDAHPAALETLFAAVRRAMFSGRPVVAAAVQGSATAAGMDEGE
jgi:hypothetical protein